MTLRYDLYWSFRSPYSYLVTPRLGALQQEYDVEANVRVVYPIAVRQPDFFAHSDRLWFTYFLRDVFRSAEYVGLPFAWASPDPVVMDPGVKSWAAGTTFAKTSQCRARKQGCGTAPVLAALAIVTNLFKKITG